MDEDILTFFFAVTDRFQIIRKLGEGGMGIVYEAFDRERDVRIALKLLRTKTADLLFRFKREFREFHQLNHPNLVSLGELYESGDEWFFTMEPIEGTNWLEYVGCGARITKSN